MSKISTVEAPAELLAFLFAHWPEQKRKQVRTWLKFQAVSVNGRPVTQFNHPLHPGDKVEIRTDRAAIPKSELPSGIKILHEDAHLIVIDKPEDLLSIASEAEGEKTAYFQLTEYMRQGRQKARERVWIVHRLDRETSGLMVFAKTAEAKEALQTGWDQAEKRYEAVVEGRLAAESGVFASDLDETNPFRVRSAPRSAETRHAVTHYRVLSSSPRYSLVELTLETGRRHQIRVHLADAGCPVVGDKKYGSRTDPEKRLALHACHLRIVHPGTGREMTFDSPLPKNLARLAPPASRHPVPERKPFTAPKPEPGAKRVPSAAPFPASRQAPGRKTPAREKAVEPTARDHRSGRPGRALAGNKGGEVAPTARDHRPGRRPNLERREARSSR